MSETTSGKIIEAMVKVMAEVGVIGKDRKNPQQGYQFRGIDDVLAVVQPLLAKHGVIVTPEVVEHERETLPTKSGGTQFSVRLLVRHTFRHIDGSFVVATTLGEAIDTGDKASNKAMSQALKYAVTESFAIPTKESDRDTEEHSPEVGAMPARSTPPASTKASAPADDLERAKAKARAAFETSPDLPSLEDSWNKLVRPLPKADADELIPAYRARQQAIRQASGVKA
ncbi:MAG TPA: ERF family protein [Archangium sp.]